MARLFALLILAILIVPGFAQTSDLVFFTDDATAFTLVIDGEEKNMKPTTRVVATGIRTETPVIIVRFADPAIPQLKKTGFFELGKEYTLMITTNKKGERVLRPSGEAALGTAAATEPVKAKPVEFQEDAPAVIKADPVQSGTITTTTVVEEISSGDQESININMGVNGMGIDMSVKVDDGTGTAKGTSTKTTTTTSTVVSTSTMGTPVVDTKPVLKEPAVYSMPGYTGRVGCAWPMSAAEFAEAKKSIESKSFEDTKMTMAKQVGSGRCFTVDQVKGLVGLFGFEDSKLDFAKYAYERTFDIDNYYKVNDSFSFESSVEELNSYIEAH